MKSNWYIGGLRFTISMINAMRAARVYYQTTGIKPDVKLPVRRADINYKMMIKKGLMRREKGLIYFTVYGLEMYYIWNNR